MFKELSFKIKSPLGMAKNWDNLIYRFEIFFITPKVRFSSMNCHSHKTVHPVSTLSQENSLIIEVFITKGF